MREVEGGLQHSAMMRVVHVRRRGSAVVGACVVNHGLLEVWTVWWCLEFKNRDVQAHMSCHQRVLSLKPASQLPRS